MKPIVDYVGRAEPVFVNNFRHAILYPVNHPFLSNDGDPIRTSRVLNWRSDGEIETLNTIYVPVRMPKLPWETRSDKVHD